jgi:hypothetical protein
VRNVSRWAAVVLLGLVAGAALPAQTRPAQSTSRVEPAALKHGRLLVWVVHPTPTPLPKGMEYGSAAMRPPGYHEQTAGSFGHSTSEIGTAASNVGLPTDSPLIARGGQTPNTVDPADQDAATAAAAGYKEQTAGTFGQNASSVGTTAGRYGQSPSTVGQSAGSVGTTAGNYGQTAGSYGHSLSTIAQAGEPAAPVPVRGVEAIVEPKLRASYPELTVQFVSVDMDKLSTTLRTATTSPNLAEVYPDVLVFEGFPASWQGVPESVQRYVKEGIGGSAPVRNAAAGALAARRVVVMSRSRRQPIAIAFAEYLQNEGLLKTAR